MTIPDDLQTQVELSSMLGVQLYLQDKASAIGTDVMLTHLSEAEQSGLGGYLTVREGSSPPAWLVLFYTAEEDPRLAFQARIPMQPGERPRFGAFEPPALPSESIEVLIRARNTALAALRGHSQPLNSVVLPGSIIGHDGVLVYMLAGTTQSGVAVMGQHFRVLVSSDGGHVERILPLTRSMFEIPYAPPAGSNDKVEAITVTHIVTEYPLETHVFASLVYKVPIYVVTSRGTWYIEADKISYLGPLKAGSS